MAQVLHQLQAMRVDTTKTDTLAGDAGDERFAAALARVESGTFGLCLDCGRPIERKKLDREPFTERCARCRRKSACAGALEASSAS